MKTKILDITRSLLRPVGALMSVAGSTATIAALFTSSAMLSSVANAEEMKMYLGGQYSLMEIEAGPGGSVADIDADAINVLFGYALTKHVAVEALAGTQINNARDRAQVDIELQSIFGVSLVGSVPIFDQLRVYAKAGFAHIELQDNKGRNADGTDPIYGGGLAYDASDKVTVNLEYMVYPDAEEDGRSFEIENSAINLGFFVRF